MAFATLLGEEDTVGPLMAVATFPIVVGIAYLGLWFFIGRAKELVRRYEQKILLLQRRLCWGRLLTIPCRRSFPQPALSWFVLD